MQINIDEIREGGLREAWDLSRESVDAMLAGDPAGYRASGPMHVDADLHRMHERVLLSARSEAKLTVPCGRCLRPVPVSIPVEVDRSFVPAGGAEARRGSSSEEADPSERHRAGSFGTDDVDEETYIGKVLDLDPSVREALLLALPPYPVCREDCKGLCPKCGNDLNAGECGCDRTVPDPRWAALEKLRPKT